MAFLRMIRDHLNYRKEGALVTTISRLGTAASGTKSPIAAVSAIASGIAGVPVMLKIDWLRHRIGQWSPQPATTHDDCFA
jgi:hypothetical protein